VSHTTGVFFNEIFSGRDWIIIGDKYARFPRVMEEALNQPGVRLYSSPKVTEELLLQVHSARFVADLKRAWYCDGTLHSVGSCVAALEAVLSDEITNALAFNVAAGHHAERDYSWGGTYASCAGPAIANARQKFGPKRFAILDTDAHHGNGTRDILRHDPDVLHVCFCSSSKVEDNHNMICVDAGWRSSDREYLENVRKEFVLRAQHFRPDVILHNLGHDTCEGDYGDLGLTPAFYLDLAREIRDCGEELCHGRYVIITHGGCRADVAEYIFPKIIGILAGAPEHQVPADD
jgi:acetoin utilization deacetylase AcuC-like enzyme